MVEFLADLEFIDAGIDLFDILDVHPASLRNCRNCSPFYFHILLKVMYSLSGKDLASRPTYDLVDGALAASRRFCIDDLLIILLDVLVFRWNRHVLFYESFGII
jgi:hypothetical protein